MIELIYADHAATSPMAEEVIEVMGKTMKENYGNPSSIHGFGRDARAKLDQARQKIASSIQAKPSEIIFTSGGSESNNTAIIKVAEANAKFGKHIISSQVEHPSVLQALAYLKEKGYEVTHLPVDQEGQFSLSDLKESIRPDTILVTLMLANNEVASLMPIQSIGEYLAKEHPQVLFHTDAVQAYGMLPIAVDELKVDFLSASAHKLNGPKGVGFLYVREGSRFKNFVVGGDQEQKRRAGTENLPGIVGFQKAVELAQKTDQQAVTQALGNYFLALLEQAGIDHRLNGSREKLGHIWNLHLPGLPADQAIIQLDLAGIAVSTGSACTAGNVDPSHVLIAMYGEEAPEVKESIRFSFGLGTDKKAIEAIVAALEKIYKR